MHIRLILAVWACKLAIFVSRLLGKKGSSMPGQLAFTICPSVLQLLSRQVKREILVVCGTNGKTTTNNLLAAFIKSAGHTVVCNNLGANMLWGVCCAFAEKANLLGKLHADYACIEVDEASAVKVFRYMKPDVMIITNLFRDQLDRYGEIDLTIDYLRRALELAPDTRLLLNGDDPLVAQFGQNTERTCYYMGVDEDTGVGLDETKEGRFCVFCGERLDYAYYHYSQLGNYHCPKCGFCRPKLDFRVHDVSLANGLCFTLDYKDSSTRFDVNYRGFYNIYNIVLSYGAALVTLGSVPHYENVLAAYKPQIGRMEEFAVGSGTVILNLAKNPAGFNQAISTVLKDEREKDLLIAINDNGQDGKDISWIWDVDFERLANAKVHRLVVTGVRADDLALRLKHAGFAPSVQTKVYDLKTALKTAADGDCTVCYALVNYTVVFAAQSILKELEANRHGA